MSEHGACVSARRPDLSHTCILDAAKISPHKLLNSTVSIGQEEFLSTVWDKADTAPAEPSFVADMQHTLNLPPQTSNAGEDFRCSPSKQGTGATRQLSLP